MLGLSGFFGAFFAYLYLYLPQGIDPDSQTVNTPQDKLKLSYDFIIVGGGTTGCVLANRLTENPNLSVLLIESGGDENAVSDNPLIYSAAYNTDLDWNYTTTSQPKICLAFPGKKCSIAQGHVLGGSSAIDTLWYARGNKEDYDELAEVGNKEWSYKNMLYYFKKMENCQIPNLVNSPFHGVDGPWPVQYPRYVTKLREEYLKAGQEFGWKKRDYNGEHQTGIGYTQLSLEGATGTSTAQSYLALARKRKNLTVIKRARVSKIVIEEKTDRAEGVEYVRYGRKYTIRAEREVIVSAGTINTPKLLMLSGIGPREELKKLKITSKRILPVGKNLQDQPAVDVIFEINQRLTITTNVWRTNQSIIEYAKDEEGPLSTTGEEANSYFNSLNIEEAPNIGFGFFSWIPLLPLNETQNKPLIAVRVTLLYANSTGTVTLKSTNFNDEPLINPNYLSSESDYIALERGIRTIFEYMTTPTMMKYSPRLNTDYTPECDGKNGRELVRCLIRYGSMAAGHPTGTAKMGPFSDINSVVNSKDLKVKGFSNLRIVDGSIIPHTIRGNTLICSIAMAEKASDLIKKDYPTKSQETTSYKDKDKHKPKPKPVYSDESFSYETSYKPQDYAPQLRPLQNHPIYSEESFSIESSYGPSEYGSHAPDLQSYSDESFDPYETNYRPPPPPKEQMNPATPTKPSEIEPYIETFLGALKVLMDYVKNKEQQQ